MSASNDDPPDATKPGIWGTPWGPLPEPRPPDPGAAPAQISLMQGDIEFSSDPKILMTVLGSCVAVCLWDKVRGAGGMNHFVLPSDPYGERSTRYGDVAIEELIAGLLHLGCRVTDLQAKLFGGAAVLPFAGGQTVGSSNVQLALERLRQHRIKITAQRTGGILGQQIRFYTKTGDVFVRYIRTGVRGSFPPGTSIGSVTRITSRGRERSPAGSTSKQEVC